MKIDIEEVEGLIMLAKAYKPLIEKVADEVVGDYAPILGKVVDGLREYSIKSNTDSFKQYVENGFTREEALLLVINTRASLQEALSNVSGNKTKK